MRITDPVRGTCWPGSRVSQHPVHCIVYSATCMHVRNLKAQMMEHRIQLPCVVRKSVMKQIVYARMAAQAVGQVKENEK